MSGREWKPGDVAMVKAHLQAALREFANPKPPKPEEPTGLGAVVEDVDGRRWVYMASINSATAIRCWRMAGFAKWCNYDDIAAVRVLSEGVQP